MAGPFDFLFGGGGGGGAADSSEELLKFLREQQTRVDTITAREKQTATAITSMRRNELLDRSGYQGTVNVGGAVQTDERTMATYYASLPADDPGRIAYEQAQTKEADQGMANWRVITGEQYDAEDAFSALLDRLPKDASQDQIQAALDKAAKLQTQYDFYDPSKVTDELNKRLKKAKERAALTYDTPYESGSAAADGGAAAAAAPSS